jgi:diacylglycerol kinase (ATP)
MAGRPRVGLIVNPAAGNGRGFRLGEATARAVSALGDVHRWDTRELGDERRCAAEALMAGVEWLAIVGGDGTWGNAAGVVAQAPASERPTLLLVAGGTGNDFPKSLGSPAHDPAALVKLAQAGHVRRVDMGAVGDRPFLNAAGFGFDARVCEVMLTHKRRTGRAVYVLTAVQQLLAYPGLAVSVNHGSRGQQLMLVFSNGTWFGGSFRIAPSARLDDGALTVTGIADATPWRRAALFGKAFRGTHVQAPEVRSWDAAETHLHFDSPPIFEADGEFARAATPDVVVRCLPAVLKIVAPAATVGR